MRESTILNMSVQLNPGIYTLCNLGLFEGIMGDKLKAKEALEKMMDCEGLEFHNSYVGQVYAAIGELDEAFRYFDKAIEQKDSDLLFLRFKLRDTEFMKDPRTENLLKRIGIPY